MNNSTDFLQGLPLKKIGAPCPTWCKRTVLFIAFHHSDQRGPAGIVDACSAYSHPHGGAVGGIFFFLMGFLWFPKGNQKLIAIIFSTILYFVAIWISAVIAFNFTGHWD